MSDEKLKELFKKHKDSKTLITKYKTDGFVTMVEVDSITKESFINAAEELIKEENEKNKKS